MPATGRTALYRLFDADRRLLYVGIAATPLTRWQAHASDKHWWDDVDVKEIEWCATCAEAEAAEVQAIATEKPLWNKSSGVASSRMESDVSYGLGTNLKRSLQRFKRAERAYLAAKAALEAEVVKEFKAGTSAATLATHVPWGKAAILALAKRDGVPKLRKPTVGKGTRYPGLRQAQRAAEHAAPAE